MFALGACSWEASTTWSILHDSQHIPMGQQLVISFEAHAQRTRMHIREGQHACFIVLLAGQSMLSRTLATAAGSALHR
jgi:hypothetical protein